MNQPVDGSPPAAGAADLRPALESALSRHLGQPRRIVHMERRPSAYRSSFMLEEVDVRFDDGTSLQVMFKDLSRQALLETARRVKPAFLYDPLREIETYRTILAQSQLGSATYYGAMVDASLGRYWLFLEKVPGLELYRVGDFAIWRQVSRWLARLHTRFAAKGVWENLAPAAHLLRYNRDYYWLWMRRALRGARSAERGSAGASRSRRRSLEWLARRYSQVVERLLTLPPTLIHGEFYASNVLVHETGDALRVCPVDWEMAAAGPGLIDLAALTAGSWTDEQKAALAAAYHTALKPDGRRSSPDAFLTDLECCQLHLAVRWLGWSPAWSPPPEHDQNWLGEAVCLAKKLGL